MHCTDATQYKQIKEKYCAGAVETEKCALHKCTANDCCQLKSIAGDLGRIQHIDFAASRCPFFVYYSGGIPSGLKPIRQPIGQLSNFFLLFITCSSVRYAYTQLFSGFPFPFSSHDRHIAPIDSHGKAMLLRVDAVFAFRFGFFLACSCMSIVTRLARLMISFLCARFQLWSCFFHCFSASGRSRWHEWIVVFRSFIDSSSSSAIDCHISIDFLCTSPTASAKHLK